jgi:hypothetical protein
MCGCLLFLQVVGVRLSKTEARLALVVKLTDLGCTALLPFSKLLPSLQWRFKQAVAGRQQLLARNTFLKTYFTDPSRSWEFAAELPPELLKQAETETEAEGEVQGEVQGEVPTAATSAGSTGAGSTNNNKADDLANASPLDYWVFLGMRRKAEEWERHARDMQRLGAALKVSPVPQQQQQQQQKAFDQPEATVCS